MPRSSHTKTHNIFLLDKSKLPGMSRKKTPTTENALAELMKDDKPYKMQTLKPKLNTQGFSVCLYFRGDTNHRSKLASFCKSFVDEHEEAVTFCPCNASSVLFIWNDKHIYAVTTGQGFRKLEEYFMPKFGLILASIFEKHFKITSLDSNTMSSIVHSTKTVYSNEIDFIDVNALDTVFKEITGRLKSSSDVKSLLALPEKSKKNSMKLKAKNYVQFSNSLDFEGLLHLLSTIDSYDFDNIQDKFNLIVPLNSQKDKTRISDAVFAEIRNTAEQNKEFPFELFHEDTIEYISADSYELYDSKSEKQYATCEEEITLQDVWDAYIKNKSELPENNNSFNNFATSLNIRAKKGDSPVTDSPFINHISGEICSNNINYYIFYGKYYHLNTAYTDRLNDALSGKLRQRFYTNELQTDWKKSHDEDWFNKTVSEKEGYIHLHKVKPDFIEFADLLKVENDIVTVVHVKDGFDCDMRALERQVELSITKVQDIKHNNNDTYMRELYEKASAQGIGTKITEVFPDVEDFLRDMKGKKIRYVIAIRPANKELIANKSNIAKHCLNSLILRCFQHDYELQIQVL